MYPPSGGEDGASCLATPPFRWGGDLRHWRGMSTATVTLDHGRHAIGSETASRLASDLVAELVSQRNRIEGHIQYWDDQLRTGRKIVKHIANRARVRSHRHQSALMTTVKVSVALVGVMMAAAL